MQEGKEEQNKSGFCPYISSRGQAPGTVLSSARSLLALHDGASMRRPTAALKEGTAAWRLVVTTAAGDVAGGRAAVVGRDVVGPKGGFALVLITTIAKAEHLLTVVNLGAAPDTATIFPKHPHVEGRITVILEMEGAPHAQAARRGKRLPATGQGYVACYGDLDRDPGSPATAVVRLQPEPAWTRGWQLINEETRELKPVAGQVLRLDDKLRQHLHRVEARPGRPRDHDTSPFIDRTAAIGAAPTMRSGTVTAVRGCGGGRSVLAGTTASMLGRRRAEPLARGLPFLHGEEPLRRHHWCCNWRWTKE